MARARAEGAHTTCAGLGPSARRAGRGRLGWEWRLRRQECWSRAQPAYAVFQPQQLKNGNFRNSFF